MKRLSQVIMAISGVLTGVSARLFWFEGVALGIILLIVGIGILVSALIKERKATS